MLVNLNEILKKAKEEKYAVGLFNTTDSDMLDAVISVAEELNAPVIIGTAEVLLPHGELSLILPSMVAKAKSAKVPVAVHYDHGLTFERCMQAVSLGVSSLMFDGSTYSIKENIEKTKEIVKIAHSLGLTVEGEIGRIGQASDGDADCYTTSEDAKFYADATGVDALAVAIGTAHGEYKSKPKLDIERLKQISSVCSVPLVLHGGSGLSDEDFINTVKNGISKVNIFTDLCLAGNRAMKDGLKKGLSYLEVRDLKVGYIKQAVREKMQLFGCVNKG